MGFLCKFTNALELISVVLVLLARPSVAPGIPPARSLSPPRRLRSLHPSADHLELPTRLDHPFASADRVAVSTRRPAFIPRVACISRRAFRDLFAASFSRARLGRHRELAARAATIQGPLSALVRPAGLRPLLYSFRSTKRPLQTGMGSRFSALAFSRSLIGASAQPARVARNIGSNAAVLLGLLMSALLVGLLVDNQGVDRRGVIPSDRVRGWRPLAAAVDQVRSRFRKADRSASFPDRRSRAIALPRWRFICRTNEWKGRGIRRFTSSNRRTC